MSRPACHRRGCRYRCDPANGNQKKIGFHTQAHRPERVEMKESILIYFPRTRTPKLLHLHLIRCREWTPHPSPLSFHYSSHICDCNLEHPFVASFEGERHKGLFFLLCLLRSVATIFRFVQKFHHTSHILFAIPIP